MVAVQENLPSTSHTPHNCDRYGHSLREASTSLANHALELYLTEKEEQVMERWFQLYRNLYEDRATTVSQEELVAVIQATLRGLCRDLSLQVDTFEDERRRRVQRRICLAGWECHGYLVPSQDWLGREDLGAVRAALKKKLLLILDHLIA